MSDDEADPELLALLRQSLGLDGGSATAEPDTGVLKSAQYIYDNAIDVSISSPGTKAAAETIWTLMKERDYSTKAWSEQELHPKSKDEATVNFIFTMNLLNFSFWSTKPDDQRFAIDFKWRKWTGYSSLVAALQRGLKEGHPITTPSFYASPETCPDLLLAHIFRSASPEPMPMLSERIAILRSAGTVLSQPSTTPLALIQESNHSAARLVNLLVEHLPSCFNDIHPFQGKDVKLHKRAQILVADLWACFDGESYGKFDDISTALTMFADYRVPQMLHSLGCLWYSPRLEGRIKRGELIQSGESVEIEIRGCSIWCVELIRREIEQKFRSELVEWKAGREGRELNAVLIDYLLYDLAKEKEKEKEMAGQADDEQGEGHGLSLPHHRTRSIWY